MRPHRIGSGGHCEGLGFYPEPERCLWRALSRGGPRSDLHLDGISLAPVPILD